MIKSRLTIMEYIHDLSHKDISYVFDILHFLVWEKEDEISETDMKYLEQALGFFEEIKDQIEAMES